MRKALAALLAMCAIGVAAIAASGPVGARDSNAMTVTMSDYAYNVDGQLHPGIATITLKNKGEESHVMALIPLKKGVTRKQVLKALKSDNGSAFEKIAAGEADFGAPTILTPGQETKVVTDKVAAGPYAMICFFADAKGKPHFLHGMVQLLTVKGKPGTDVPDAAAEVDLTDTAISVPPGNAPSDLTVRITNSGTAVHSFLIVQLNGSATIDEVDAFFDSFEGGPWPDDAPGAIVGGIGDLRAGGTAYLTWKDLPPGRYGYVSASGGDEEGNNDDIAKGLKGEFTIG